ncbi:MAG: cyanophycinase [Chitinophagaceae bacterium]|nr:MAG: cyanophycinase [Chitinophagaceae bacterium]
MSKRNGNSCPVPKGILVVIGGAEEKLLKQDEEGKDDKMQEEEHEEQEVLKAFVGLMSRKESPLIEVVTTSSGDPEGSFNDYKKTFAGLGIRRVHQIHHNSRGEVLDDNLAKRVDEADAFFFTGGDQLKLTSIYGGTSFLTGLKNRYITDRVIIAGTSAGAMALSTPMIYAGNKDVQQIGGEIKITTGLEFLKDVCVDTHFVDRSRFVRMAQVVETNPTCIGLGIEENTAVIVRNGSDAEVIGGGMVIVIDGFHIRDTNIEEFTEKKIMSVRDLKVHILGKGQHYQIPQCNPPHH